jgi:UDP-2,4-diacetamido-2,4,6-trideoxy-beta-L-altropyranose hydrolase
MIVFRVDASPAFGSGHAMRCLALAEAWLRTRESALFVTACEAFPSVTAAGIETIAMTGEPGSEADAQATVALAREHDADWLVVDGYRFPEEFQRVLKAAGCRVLVIDDHGHAGHYRADLVLDQNATASAASYASRDAGTRLLLGSRYVLLREQFLRPPDWRRAISARARRVLVTFGGADPAGATRLVIEALASLPDLEIVAVVGPHATLDLPEIPQLRVERAVTEMAALMRECDLAITAAGSTCWELAYLQTPMLVMPIAGNQQPIAEVLAARGVAVNLGWPANATPAAIATATAALLADQPRRQSMAAAGRALIDGHGAARVVVHLKKALISLRPATDGDARRVWEWSNEPEVRAASFRSEPIPWEAHERWFATRLRDAATKFYIAEKHGPLGQTRFAISADEATISTSLDAVQRGRGLGSAVILAACERLFVETPVRRVRAFIKPLNDASLLAFARAGFDRVEDVRIEGEAAAQFILEKEAA